MFGFSCNSTLHQTSVTCCFWTMPKPCSNGMHTAWPGPRWNPILDSESAAWLVWVETLGTHYQLGSTAWLVWVETLGTHYQWGSAAWPVLKYWVFYRKRVNHTWQSTKWADSREGYAGRSETLFVVGTRILDRKQSLLETGHTGSIWWSSYDLFIILLEGNSGFCFCWKDIEKLCIPFQSLICCLTIQIYDWIKISSAVLFVCFFE